MSVLKEVLFGKQNQAARQMEVVEEFVKEYVGNRVSSVNWEDRVSIEEGIGAVLQGLIEKAPFLSVNPDDEVYLSPVDWVFIRIFLGYEAVNDIWNSGECIWEIDRNIQENGKVVFYAWMAEDEDGQELDKSEPKFVDASDAEKIVDTVISYCPPSEREKLPADDKLAAVLLSRSYWQGQLG